MQNESMERKEMNANWSGSAPSHIFLKRVAYTNKERKINSYKKENKYHQAGVESQYICTLQVLSQQLISANAKQTWFTWSLWGFFFSIISATAFVFFRISAFVWIISQTTADRATGRVDRFLTWPKKKKRLALLQCKHDLIDSHCHKNPCLESCGNKVNNMKCVKKRKSV